MVAEGLASAGRFRHEPPGRGTTACARVDQEQTRDRGEPARGCQPAAVASSVKPTRGHCNWAVPPSATFKHPALFETRRGNGLSIHVSYGFRFKVALVTVPGQLVSTPFITREPEVAKYSRFGGALAKLNWPHEIL